MRRSSAAGVRDVSFLLRALEGHGGDPTRPHAYVGPDFMFRGALAVSMLEVSEAETGMPGAAPCALEGCGRPRTDSIHEIADDEGEDAAGGEA